jgi:hypothetical protein
MKTVVCRASPSSAMLGLETCENSVLGKSDQLIREGSAGPGHVDALICEGIK